MIREHVHPMNHDGSRLSAQPFRSSSFTIKDTLVYSRLTVVERSTPRIDSFVMENDMTLY